MLTGTLFSTLAALPALGGRVTTASTLESAIEAIKSCAVTPCAVLHGLAEKAAPNDLSTGGTRHRVEVELRLLLVSRDVSDPHGAAALAALEPARTAVLAALLGLVPASGYAPLEYHGGQLAYAQAGTIIWLDSFKTAYYLRKT